MRLVSLVVLFIALGLPQDCASGVGERGTALVITDSSLYTEISPGSLPKSVIKRGTSVTVEIEIAASDGSWCGISENAEFVGYLKCGALRRNLPRRAEWHPINPVSGKRHNYGATDVIISGNKVLVPVQLGFREKSVEALLLLDTGATGTMIDSGLASELGIEPSDMKMGAVRGIGDIVIQAAFAKLNFINVGPHYKEDIVVSIVRETARGVSYNGLLGMDFLRDLKYSIDFGAKKIEWRTD